MPYQEADNDGGIEAGEGEEVEGNSDQELELVDSSLRRLREYLATYGYNDCLSNNSDQPKERYGDDEDGSLENKDRDGGLGGGENAGGAAAEYLWESDYVSHQPIGKTIHTWSLAQSMEGLRLPMLMQSRGPKWWGVQSTPCRRWRMPSDWTHTEKMSGVAAAAALEIPRGCVQNMIQGIYNREDSFDVDDGDYVDHSNSLLPTTRCSCSLKDDGVGKYLRKTQPSQPEMAPAL